MQVDTFPRAEAAARAGIDPANLDRMVELQVIAPSDGDRFTLGEVRKAAMLAGLETGGVPLEAVATEIHGGRLSLDFMDDPVFGWFSALSPLTFDDLAAQAGVRVELMLVIREAVGSAVPRPTDHVREIELAIVPLIEAQLASGYPEDVVERSLRTMGESLRRFVLAEADDFRAQVIWPVSDRTGAEISVTAATVSQRLSAPADQALLSIYHAQQAHAWTTNIIDGFERAIERSGINARIDRPPVMCFLDLTGYTRFTSERGDEAAAALADRLKRIVERTAIEHAGRAVKWLGDGVMFHFRDSGPAVLAALEMIDSVTSGGLPPAHVGLHAGPVIFQDGDYYGQTVNVASRIAEYARPGEVLVSQEVVDAAGDVPITFVPVGPVELKGVGGNIALHVAQRA